MSRYYKILPENLNCDGFQYHEGFNIDVHKIDECILGYGLHFADAAHILSFCDYGSMIAEVEIPDDATVYNFINEFKADKIILKNIRPLWNIETIETLIQEGVEFETYINDMLCEATKRGYLDIIKYLVWHGANIYSENDDILCLATCNGHFDIVKYFVEQGADIHAQGDYPLRVASKYGYLDIVKYLVEHGADIHAYDDYALRIASANGHPDIVQYLVEHGANALALNYIVFLIARRVRFKEIAKQLKALL